MLELKLSTPALLFSATSLILLAYTNRFLTVATIVRGLKKEYDTNTKDSLVLQIANLGKRVRLIRYMQMAGVISLFFSVFSMLMILFNWKVLATSCFVISLVLMLISLALSAYEINISVKALKIHLGNLKDKI